MDYIHNVMLSLPLSRDPSLSLTSKGAHMWTMGIGHAFLISLSLASFSSSVHFNFFESATEKDSAFTILLVCVTLKLVLFVYIQVGFLP